MTIYDVAQTRVREALATGAPADFRTASDPGDLPSFDHDAFWADRTLDGAWLSELLVGPDGTPHRRGFAIIGARISGDLDLAGIRLGSPLALISCHFGTGSITIRDSAAQFVALSGSTCAQVDLARLRATGPVLLQTSRLRR